jgi:dihydrofolate reductase
MRTAGADSSAADGRWVADNETMTFINETYQRADAFLFGRRTYELFAGYWGAEERARAAAEDPRNHPITAALNTKPKYLVSTTLTEPRWRTRPSSPVTSRRPSAS